MSRMYGADADQLDHLAREVEASGSRMRSSQAALGRAIHSSPWQGRGADRFRQQWDGEYRRSMIEASRFLDDAGDALRRNAREQREASGAAGGRISRRAIPRMRRREVDPSILRAILEYLGLPLTIAKGGVRLLKAIVKAATPYLQHVKGYTTAAGRVVGPYVRWKAGTAATWHRIIGQARDVAKLNHYLKWTGRGLIVLGGVITGVTHYLDDRGRPTGERIARATAVGAVDTGVKWAGAKAGAVVGAKGGALAGAAIGSVIPGVGTVVGGAVGGVVGGVGGAVFGAWGASKVAERFDVSRRTADAASAVYNGAGRAISSGVESGRRALEAGGSLLSGGANLAKRGLGGLFPG